MGPYGIPLDRAMAPEARFVAEPTPTLNKAVAAVEVVRDRYFKQWPNAPKAGLHWTVRELKADG